MAWPGKHQNEGHTGHGAAASLPGGLLIGLRAAAALRAHGGVT